MNKIVASILAIVFVGVCVLVLLKQQSSSPSKDPVTLTPGSSAQTPANVARPADPSKPPSETMTLTVVSGFTKKTWLDQAVDSFNQRHELVDGKTVVIKAQYANSGDVLRDIQEGRLKPELWSPADESWFKQANEWWRAQYSKDLVGPWKPLVNVPLVIAMWEPMAKALGYPNPIGWADMARLSTDPQGWARYGHPEWGRFTWGHCHPDSANGFQTLVCAIYAATGKSTGLTVEDMKRPDVAERLKVLEQSVEHYGISSRWIDDFMRAKGPAYLSAAAQYENNVIEGNLRSENKPFPLVCIYPKEGTIFNTNPITVLQADWVSDSQRQAGNHFIEFLLSSSQQAEAVKTGLRPAGSTTAPGGPFTAANGVAEALPAITSFEVPTDAILKRVRDLWFETKRPASVTLIIDVSGSMKGEPLEKAKEGALTFLDQMYPKDEVEIIAFSDRITTLVEMAPVGKVREAARERIQGLYGNGGTRLYDVTSQTLKRIATLRQAQAARQYGVVLLTDGKDEGSTLPRQDLMDQFPRDDAPEVVKIFTIGFGDKLDKAFLREVSNRSNARMYESTAKNLVQVYAELSANF